MNCKPNRFTPATVRQFRLDLRLTQADFARLVGVSRRTVIRWEQGSHLPESHGRNYMHRQKVLGLMRKYEEWCEHVRAGQCGDEAAGNQDADE